jgi:hypothetical protein
MVATVPDEVRPASICPKCGRELPALAQKCASCGEYRNWKGWLKPVAAVVTFLLATTAGVLGISSTLRSNSRTQVSMLDSTDDGTLIAVVANTGKGKTRDVGARFRLEAAQPEIIGFGPLAFLSPKEQRVIAPGGQSNLEFEISSIQTSRDVRSHDFWTQYGAMEVSLLGEVEESNGRKHELRKTVPLNALKSLVEQWMLPRTKITTLDQPEDKRLFEVGLTNAGKHESFVDSRFELQAAEPNVLEFGPLRVVSPNKERTIAAGAKATLHFDIVYIRPTADVEQDGFWTDHGDMPVTLTGRVKESNGEHDLRKTVPLSDLRAFVELRSNRPEGTP